MWLRWSREARPGKDASALLQNQSKAKCGLKGSAGQREVPARAQALRLAASKRRASHTCEDVADNTGASQPVIETPLRAQKSLSPSRILRFEPAAAAPQAAFPAHSDEKRSWLTEEAFITKLGSCACMVNLLIYNVKMEVSWLS